VNCLGYAVLGGSLVCAILAGVVSPTFSAGIVASLTACLITGSNYRCDDVLKEDAMALERHHISLEENVQVWKLLMLSSRAACAALQLSKARNPVRLDKSKT
jgi:ribonuclease PH